MSRLHHSLNERPIIERPDEYSVSNTHAARIDEAAATMTKPTTITMTTMTTTMLG